VDHLRGAAFALAPQFVITVEIHGYVGCAFAWRVRLTAAEKGVSFDWIPCDVETPDPRAAANNPHEHSPLLFHDGYSLLESEVIANYIDEQFPGRPLMPDSPRARATLRLLGIQLRAVDVHTEPSRPEARRKTEPALATLESVLANGGFSEGRQLEATTNLPPGAARPFIHGEAPGIVDLMVWPFLFHSAGRGLISDAAFPLVTAYLRRAATRPSFNDTRPPWAQAR